MNNLDKYKNTIDQGRLESLAERFPLLMETVRLLNENSISFLIAGSGCLYLYGNERLPGDVDIFISSSMHDKADSVFGINSFQYKSEIENVRNSNPKNDHSIQLTSGLKITVAGLELNLDLSPEVFIQAEYLEFKGQKFGILPPEDALLIKAILQRGEDVGKNDIKDIQTFMAIYPDLDKKYLQKRIEKLGAGERVGEVFQL